MMENVLDPIKSSYMCLFLTSVNTGPKAYFEYKMSAVEMEFVTRNQSQFKTLYFDEQMRLMHRYLEEKLPEWVTAKETLNAWPGITPFHEQTILGINYKKETSKQWK